jgi:hypothetical protein
MRNLQMSIAAMSEADLVMQAAEWAGVIVRREHRGYDDTKDAATYRTARKLKVPERLLFALRYPYRWPKSIAAGAYLKLQAAVEASLKSELQLAREAGLDTNNSPAFRAAAAALRKTESAAE